MKAEREAFRERDLAALRLQMTSVQRREADAMRKELQSQYDTRVERLREAERERERRDKDRLRDAEVSQFEARQNLLREMDLLRTREQVRVLEAGLLVAGRPTSDVLGEMLGEV